MWDDWIDWMHTEPEMASRGRILPRPFQAETLSQRREGGTQDAVELSKMRTGDRIAFGLVAWGSYCTWRRGGRKREMVHKQCLESGGV